MSATWWPWDFSWWDVRLNTKYQSNLSRRLEILSNVYLGYWLIKIYFGHLQRCNLRRLFVFSQMVMILLSNQIHFGMFPLNNCYRVPSIKLQSLFILYNTALWGNPFINTGYNVLCVNLAKVRERLSYSPVCIYGDYIHLTKWIIDIFFKTLTISDC